MALDPLLINPELLKDDKAEEIPFEFESYEEEIVFKEQLRIWTEEFGKIYAIEVNEVMFLFRTLTGYEFNFARDNCMDDFERAEYICTQCVLEPNIENYSLEIFAGIPESLCAEILKHSGFTESTVIEKTIARWELEIQKVENQLPLVIKEAFQDIPLSEIESWTMDKTAEYYVKAKWTLENFRGVTLQKEDES